MPGADGGGIDGGRSRVFGQSVSLAQANQRRPRPPLQKHQHQHQCHPPLATATANTRKRKHAPSSPPSAVHSPVPPRKRCSLGVSASFTPLSRARKRSSAGLTVPFSSFSLFEDHTEQGGGREDGVTQDDEEEEEVVPQCDKDNRDIESCVVEYTPEIITHLRLVEGKWHPCARYMSTQAHINPRMRSILVEWLLHVHYRFRLQPETLFLGINLLDRFLEKKQVTQHRLQLTGCVALQLAAKYEEIYAPEMKDFVYISSDAFNTRDMIDLEQHFIRVLSFNLTVPTAYQFGQRFLQMAKADEVLSNLAHFLMEASLVEYRMLRFLPSMVAASCLFLALKLIGRRWTAELVTHVRYDKLALKPCVTEIHDSITDVANDRFLKSVRKKYATEQFGKVSTLFDRLVG